MILPKFYNYIEKENIKQKYEEKKRKSMISGLKKNNNQCIFFTFENKIEYP